MDAVLYLIAGLALAVALRALWSDWMQTRWISKFGAARGIFETNLFLGKSPSILRVNLWFCFWHAALVAALFFVPPEWAIGLYLIAFLVERHYILSNRRIGVETLDLWS